MSRLDQDSYNVRCFTFVFSVKGMISVILILVVSVYQQILSNTEQGSQHEKSNLRERNDNVKSAYS